MSTVFPTAFASWVFANPTTLNGASLGLVLLREAPNFENQDPRYIGITNRTTLFSMPGWLEATGTGLPLTATQAVSIRTNGANHYVLLNNFPLTGIVAAEVKAIAFYYTGTINGVTNPIIMITNDLFTEGWAVLTANDGITAQPDTTMTGSNRWIFAWADPPTGATTVQFVTGPVAINKGVPPFESSHAQHVWIFPQRSNMMANPSFELPGTNFWSTNGTMTRVAEPATNGGGWSGRFTSAVNGYLDPAVGGVSTPDTIDMAIDGSFRLSWRARIDSITPGPWMVLKATGLAPGREYLIYYYDTGSGIMTALSTDSSPGAPFGNTDIGVSYPTPLGAVHTFGIESSPRHLTVTTIFDGVRSSDAFPAGSAPVYPHTSGSVQIAAADNMVGRVYWVKMEAINRAQLVLPGVAGNYLSVPDTASLTPSGDFEAVVRVKPTTWTPMSYFPTYVGRWDWSGPSWKFGGWQNTKLLTLSINVRGFDVDYLTSTADVPFTDGVGGWLKATRIATTGVIRFYTAADQPLEPTTWTKLGADVASPTGGLLRPGTTPFRIGASTFDGEELHGRISRVIVRNGIDGPAVVDVSENDAYTPAGTVRHDFTMAPDGGIPQADTGQFWLQRGPSLPYIADGKLTADGLAGYVDVDLGAPVKHIKATFSFSSEGTTDDSFAGVLIWEHSATGTPFPPDSPLHLVVGRNYYTADIWKDQVYYGAIGGVKYYSTPLTLDTPYTIEATLQGSIWTIIGPDGVTRQHTDSRFASITGSFAGLEVYGMVPGTTHRPEFLSVEADTGGVFKASTGQSVSVAQTAGNTIVQPQPDSVIWSWDANDYVSGTTMTSGGRTWTLTASGAITPKIGMPNTRNTLVVESNVFPTFKEEVWTIQLMAKGSGTLKVGLVHWDDTFIETRVDWGTELWTLTPDSFTPIAVIRSAPDAYQGMLRVEMTGGASLTLDTVCVEAGALVDWPYFDGSSTYGARGDFVWYGGQGRQGASYSLWYNNKNAILGRMFALDYTGAQVITDEVVAEQGFVYQWVPAGTVVTPHPDVLYVNDLQAPVPPKAAGVLAYRNNVITDVDKVISPW